MKKGKHEPTPSKSVGEVNFPDFGETILNVKHFLPGTRHRRYLVNFFITNGGLGDYICYMSAMIFIAKEMPHVIGRIFVSRPFLDVAKYIMKDFPEWSCYDSHERYDQYLVEGSLVCYPKPSLHVNATGAHLMDLGFMYYAQTDRPPEGYGFMPEIHYDGPWKWPELDPESEYAVFTPGATAPARANLPHHFNDLVKHVKSLGITPVFLGRREFSTTAEALKAGYKANFDVGYDLTNGVDLIEKTTLLEAVQIMSRARFVVGIDNGLLHFAGCTSTPIVFAHTITEVRHRTIRRRQGLTYDLSVPKSVLACSGCQSNMRFIKGHKFTKCIYGHYKCLDLIYANEGEAWKKAIKDILDRTGRR